MAQLIDITRVAVSPKNFMARVKIAPGGPLTTDQDLVGTTNVYNLLPEVCDHTCLGDAGTTFKDAMGATELAHLLEHVTIELMARTGLADSITCGRTWEVEDEPRTYDIQFDCPDDVLVASALSSGAWILQWAYSGGQDPKPDVEGIIAGIKALTEQACEQDGMEAKVTMPAKDEAPAEDTKEASAEGPAEEVAEDTEAATDSAEASNAESEVNEEEASPEAAQSAEDNAQTTVSAAEED